MTEKRRFFTLIGLTALLLCICLLFSCKTTFTDDESGNDKIDYISPTPETANVELHENPWSMIDLDALITRGLIIDKDPDSQYFSNKELTWADIIYLTFTALDVPITAHEDGIIDASEDVWYKDAVNTAYKNGYLTELIDNNAITPDDSISREEMAVFIANVRDAVYGHLSSAESVVVEISDSHLMSQQVKPIVEYVVCLGIFTLDNNKRFKPENYVRGYEVSKIIANAVNSKHSAVIDIQRIVDDAYKAGNSEIVIPEGIYEISAKESGVHLLFKNLVREQDNPFTIDATGVEFVCLDYSKPAVQFLNCKNITFVGAAIGYSIPTMTQGEIKDIVDNGKTIEVLLDDGYPLIDSMTPTAYVFDKETLQMKNDCPDLYSISCEQIDDRIYHIQYDLDVRNRNVAIGDILGFRREGSFNTQLLNCEKVTIKDCTMTDGMFALHEGGGEGGNVFDGVIVTFKEKPEGALRERVLSTFADALHSDDMRIGPTIQNCHFEGMGDDCINIHGAFAMMMEKGSKGEYIIGTTGASIFDRIGDRVRIHDIQGNFLGEAEIMEVMNTNITDYQIPGGIEAVHKVNNRYTPTQFHKILINKDLDLPFGAMFSNPDRGGKGFQIRNNTFGPNRARGALIKADDGMVEGNTFIGQSIHSLLIAPEFYWNEAGFVRNLVIRGNKFINNGFVYGYQPTIVIAGEGGNTGGISHRNIIIENNTFEMNYGDSLSLRHVDGIIVRNNQFCERNNFAKMVRGNFAHIITEDAVNVEIYGNHFEGDMESVLDKGNTAYIKLEK